jgi:hypothetical protein
MPLTLGNILIIVAVAIAGILIWIDVQPDPYDVISPAPSKPAPKHLHTNTVQPVVTSIKEDIVAKEPEEGSVQQSFAFNTDYFLAKYNVDIEQTLNTKTHNTIEKQFSGKDRIIQFDHGVLLYPTTHQAVIALQDHAKNTPKVFEGVVPEGLDRSMLKIEKLLEPFSSLPNVVVLDGPSESVKKERNELYPTYAHLHQMRVMFRVEKIVHDISVIVIEDEIDALHVLKDAILEIIH